VELLLHSRTQPAAGHGHADSEAWSASAHEAGEARSSIEYHACLMEPWDGPAAIAFTDGRVIGATLDRQRFATRTIHVVTHDDLVVVASEAGVLDIARAGEEKGSSAAGQDVPGGYREVAFISSGDQAEAWRRGSLMHSGERESDHDRSVAGALAHAFSRRRDPSPPPAAFVNSDEDLRMILGPMASKGEEPVGSMGTIRHWPVFPISRKSLFNYFKQLFAQVTQSPIDPFAKEMVMSLTVHRKRAQHSGGAPENCHMLKLAHPLLSNRELEKLRRVFQSRSARDHFARAVSSQGREEGTEAGSG